MSTLIHERVSTAQSGANPTVVGRTRSGWVVMGDVQFPLGYCLLLPDPVVFSINDLRGVERAQFLADMVAIGDALLDVTDAYRVNYELQSNGDQALHAHVFARFYDEDPNYKLGPVWRYSGERRASVPFEIEVHGQLQDAIRNHLSDRDVIVVGKA